MPKIPKEHLTKRYPESKTIRNALLKRNKLDRKIAVGEHYNMVYKSMLYLAKKSVRVIENLAAAVASLEKQNKEQKEEITTLKKRLGVMKNVH